MMSGTAPPFVAPLVLNADRSSGGWISYVPIPFRESVKVRLIGAHVHYQITYQLFTAAGDLQTFTGLEDYTLAQHLWQRLGQDPKPTRGNLTDTTGHPARRQPGVGPTEQLRVLNSLQLRLPQLEPSILGTAPLDDTVAPIARWFQLYADPALHRRAKPAAHPSGLPRHPGGAPPVLRTSSTAAGTTAEDG